MPDSLIVKEIFKILNQIKHSTNIIPIVAVIVVAFIGWLFTFLIHSKDRKDKYLISLIKERFKASQIAYNYSIRFVSVIHGDEEIKLGLLRESKEWFIQNNLYLHPKIRKKFEVTLNKLFMYRNTLELYYQLKKNGNTIKAEKQYQKLTQDFKDISTLNKCIQDDIDVYYKI